VRVAITVFLTAVSVTSLSAQDTTRIFRDTTSVSAPKPYRDPHRAKVLGTILPGAGHIYAGEYFRGYTTWVVTVSGFALAPYVYEAGVCSANLTESCNPGPQWLRLLLGGFMAGAGAWSWISSARDAPHAAERANVKHRSKTLNVAPFVEPSFELAGGWNAGLAIRW
jgi:hypothetical protein